MPYRPGQTSGSDPDDFCTGCIAMMFSFVAFPFLLHCAVKLCRRLSGNQGDTRPLLRSAAAPGSRAACDVEMAQHPRRGGGGGSAAAAGAAVGENRLVLDGNEVPFEAASFGPPAWAQTEPIACLPFHVDREELHGKLLAIRRRGKLDYSFVQTIAEAEAAGALGVIVVSHTADRHLPSPPDGSAARARIQIPVMAVGLSADTATLTRVGAEAATFCFARVRQHADRPRPAASSSALTAANSNDPRVAAALRSDPVVAAALRATNRRQLAEDLAAHAAGPGSSGWQQPMVTPAAPETAPVPVLPLPPPPAATTTFEVEGATTVVSGLSVAAAGSVYVAMGEAAPAAVLGGTVLGFTPPVSGGG